MQQRNNFLFHTAHMEGELTSEVNTLPHRDLLRTNDTTNRMEPFARYIGTHPAPSVQLPRSPQYLSMTPLSLPYVIHKASILCKILGRNTLSAERRYAI